MSQNNRIQNLLKEIEESRSIEVLYAAESGSRAWGFHSEDSDWDVRFIYRHTPNYYLSLGNGKDTIEHKIGNDLDIAGWDIKKTLNLFKKSNPNLLEWLYSPIVYRQNISFIPVLMAMAEKYYSPRRCAYHHLGIVRNHISRYIEGENTVNIKKYLYILRSIAAVNWLRFEEQKIPIPALASKLFSSQLPMSIRKIAFDMIEEKRESENEEIEANKVLNDYILLYKDTDIPLRIPDSTMPEDALNLLFRTVIKDI